MHNAVRITFIIFSVCLAFFPFPQLYSQDSSEEPTVKRKRYRTEFWNSVAEHDHHMANIARGQIKTIASSLAAINRAMTALDKLSDKV